MNSRKIIDNWSRTWRTDNAPFFPYPEQDTSSKSHSLPPANWIIIIILNIIINIIVFANNTELFKYTLSYSKSDDNNIKATIRSIYPAYKDQIQWKTNLWNPTIIILQFKKVLQYNSYANRWMVSPKLTPIVCRCPFFCYFRFFYCPCV